MTTTAEISLYPLDAAYADIVTDLIHDIRRTHPALRIEVGGLSTQLIGPWSDILAVLDGPVRSALEAHPSVVVVKMALGAHSTENLPDDLREL